MGKRMMVAIGVVCVLAAVWALPAPAADDGSWERVRQAGKLVIGIDDAFPPMEFRNESNELVGFDIEASRELGRRLGIEIEHVPTAWDGVVMALKVKKFDCIWSCMSITPEREQEIAFTKPYIMEKQVLVVKSDNPAIKGSGDLTNKHVAGVQQGSTSEQALEKLGQEFKEIKRYDKNTEAFMDLKIGRIDTLAVDEIVGRYYLSQRPGEFRVLPEALTSEPVGIGIRQEDVALKAQIQKILDEMFADGTMRKISIKWFGDDITAWK